VRPIAGLDFILAAVGWFWVLDRYTTIGATGWG
jgi:hypothetical protein